MMWSDIAFRPTNKTLRQFAAAWLVFVLAFGAYQSQVRGRWLLGLALMVAAGVIGLLGMVKPVAVRWLFVGSMVLAFPVGWLISQLMLALMFFGILTPVAIFFRWQGRDLLRRKPAPDCSSFWVPKQIPSDVRSYFRPY